MKSPGSLEYRVEITEKEPGRKRVCRDDLLDAKMACREGVVGARKGLGPQEAYYIHGARSLVADWLRACAFLLRPVQQCLVLHRGL